MDEYIKREDALDAVLFALVGTGVQSRVIYAIREVPTADVVPKSEVDFLHKTIAENAQRALEVTLEEIEKAKTEVAREIFEEIENNYADFLFDGHRNIVVLTEKDFAELKKKYTEGEDER